MSKNSSDYMAYTAQLQKNRENFRKNKDDYAWDTYTQIYEKQMNDPSRPRSISKGGMLVTSFEEKDGELVFHDNLHNNWKEIYHQIHRLKIKSVFECGCGASLHLRNIKEIHPNVIVNGCDYSSSQINLGFKYYNIGDYEFSKRLVVKDLTNKYGLDNLGKHEFVYTQAVTMHLAYDKALKFLSNMKELSTKYILLTENPQHHDYNDLIAKALPEYERIIGENKYNMNAILLKRKSLTE